MFHSSLSDGRKISIRLLEERLRFWMNLAKSGEVDPWDALAQGLLVDHHKRGLWCPVDLPRLARRFPVEPSTYWLNRTDFSRAS